MQDNLPTEMPVPAAAPVSPGPMTYYNVDDEQGFLLRDYWHVLKKRKWWFWGVLSGVVGLVLLVTFLMSPIYSTTTLQIIPDNPQP
jgi:uncharacterized protein involved in exopolysaccharide biosynthesis